MKLFYLVVTSCLSGLFRLFYGHQVFGKEHFPKGPALLAPNHNSFFDPPIIGASCPGEVHYLARSTLFQNRFLKGLIEALNAYPVAGTSQDIASFKIIFDVLKKGEKVVIFPEGERSSDGQLGAIQSGIGMLALRSRCPIIPVYIHGSFEAWNRFQKFPKLLAKTACVFGTPIYPEQYMDKEKKEAQKEIADAVKQSILELQEWYLSGAQGSPP
jgi:1-acyl-sn-glycerol-3-phosphate acyltransferase